MRVLTLVGATVLSASLLAAGGVPATSKAEEVGMGGDELRYEIRINDPKTYVAPFTISLPLVSPSGYKLLPYECLEGDYAMANALSAERAEDRALVEDARKGILRPRKSITQDNVNAPRPAAGTPGAE